MMLLADFKAIADIDSQISNLHKQLEGLYEIRTEYLNQDGDTSVHSTQPTNSVSYYNHPSSDNWANTEYYRLKSVWAEYNIQMPSFLTFKKRLQISQKIIHELCQVRPEFKDKLGVMIVPPSKFFTMRLYPELFNKRAKDPVPTYVNPELEQRTRSNNWRLFVVYNAPEGLKYGNAKKILQQKSYLIKDHDMRGLGVIEYAAFSLQNHSLPDIDSWTLLLRNYKHGTGQLVPSVAYIANHYRFELDDESGLFDDERFRPTLEIV